MLNRRSLSIMVGAIAAAILTAGAMIASTAQAAVRVGEAAPAFSVRDVDGRVRTLSEFSGRTVVLEWTNHECPYVKKHYGSGNMQALQREAAARNIAWVTVISSAPGKQGHVPAAEGKRLTESRNAAPTAVLLDENGAMGRAYGARTTPHMYVIADGKIAYQGAIDDNSSADPATIPAARNHVRMALADLAASRPVAVTATQPYGCSVKY